MPYAIKKLVDNRYRVINTATKAVKAKGTTKPKAQSQVRLLNAIEHGYKPTKR